MPGAESLAKAARPEVEVGDLERNAAANLGRKANVMAVAPVIPMKLLAPVKIAAAAPADGTGMTWGVRAVGATKSPFDGEGIVVAILDTGIDLRTRLLAG